MGKKVKETFNRREQFVIDPTPDCKIVKLERLSNNQGLMVLESTRREDLNLTKARNAVGFFLSKANIPSMNVGISHRSSTYPVETEDGQKYFRRDMDIRGDFSDSNIKESNKEFIEFDDNDNG